MKKFLLVVFIGMVFVLNLYGFVNEYMNDKVVEVDHIRETTIAVYVE